MDITSVSIWISPGGSGDTPKIVTTLSHHILRLPVSPVGSRDTPKK